MSTAVQVKQNSRTDERIIFVKSALAIFDGEPQTSVKTTDLSVSGVGISSPVQGLPKSICWVRLKMPESHLTNKVFDVKTQVIYSIYSKEIRAFRTGLRFINPQPMLIEMITKLVSEKNK